MSQKINYQATIGIETHVQLKTATKLFAPVNNDARDSSPNQHVSHICLGMPGALPVLNQQALVLASRAAFALGTTPQRRSVFDRKHYFYPDLPKGYQITQQAYPIIRDGTVPIEVDGKVIEVAIERAHLEEDAGKSTHPQVGGYSLVDLNRAGTPLLEIVSAPVMHSAKQARAYVRELYLRMRYAGVSDADLYHGNMRFDVNVSVSDSDELGTRTETKNLNSFRAVERAVEYEIERQTALLQRGEKVLQETRGWDEAKQKTTSQRGKEETHDYRYFPDPDIPPVELTQSFIDDIAQAMPAMPSELRGELRGRGVSAEAAEIIIGFELDDASAEYVALLLDETLSDKQAKAIANLMVQIEIPQKQQAGARDKSTDHLSIDQRKNIYQAVLDMQADGKLSSTNVKALLQDLLFSGAAPKSIAAYADQQGYIQVSDDTALQVIVDEVIAEHEQAANDVRSGEMKAIGFLVGAVMKKSLGKANPARVKELLERTLLDSS